jgi:hypothetical protein
MHTTEASRLVAPKRELVSSGRTQRRGSGTSTSMAPPLPVAGAQAAAEHIAEVEQARAPSQADLDAAWAREEKRRKAAERSRRYRRHKGARPAR